MAIQIYNTLSKKKEELIPIEPGKVSMYLCGPTVYNYFHIGNARPFILYDIFRRYLKYRGFDVKFIMNLTDIDDRIIQKSIEDKIPASDVAKKYSDAFFDDLKKLGVERADEYPKATETIPEMITLIEKLIDNGMAYSINGDVFYSVKDFQDYGKLSGKKTDELKSGARVKIDENKKDPLDFSLWKAAKPGEPAWDSPWGKGRPGWHIECSVMSMKYLGESIDIHAGGADLIFPHHENEIAQSEGATEKPFVKYWMHNGFLNIEGEKMSKSLGNFFTAREIMEKYHPAAIRMFFLLKHYRSPISFSEDRIREAQQALERIVTTMQNIDTKLDTREFDDREIVLKESIDDLKLEFLKEMDDDFNTAGAMAKIFDLVKEANLILAKGKLPESELAALSKIKSTIEELDSFLNILYYKESFKSSIEDDSIIQILIDIRKKIRDAKNWDLSDEIRDRLDEIGIVLKDFPDKTTWQRKIREKKN
jgi:cysteinyl-tRNA synthetase